VITFYVIAWHQLILTFLDKTPFQTAVGYFLPSIWGEWLCGILSWIEKKTVKILHNLFTSVVLW